MPAPDGKKAIEFKKKDLSSLPVDAVIVICDRAEDALELSPKAVIVRPEKYQELLEQIEKLRKQLEKTKSENAVPPTRCSLRGKVGPNSVRVEAEFAGTAEHADTWVSLACPQGGVSAAETDGRLSSIRRSNAGGFQVRIDKAGEYHVKLDLVLPMSRREGNSHGFELTLPRAAITQVEFDLPVNCTDVRVAGQLLKDLPLPGLELKNNHLSGNPGFGPVDKLDLSWREPRHSAGEPVRIAEGRIQARIDATGLSTQADLSLMVEGAPTAVWRLLVPRDAEIKILPSKSDDRLVHSIDTDDQRFAFASLRTIHLKEARSDALHVQVKLPVQTLSNSLMPVGPFFVLDAARQTGTVLVRNQLRNLHVHYHLHGDMQPRRQDPEENKGENAAVVATFVYSDIPLIDRPEGKVGAKSLSWLDLETVRVQAKARMRLSHTLMLRPVGAEPQSEPENDRGASAPSKRSAGPLALRWEELTTITPITRWADVELLKILVPPDWEPKDDNSSLVPNSNPRSVTLRSSLLRDAPTQPRQLAGHYKASYLAEGRTVLKLPLPQGTIESCEVKIEAPANVEVVVNNAEQINLELSRHARPNEQTWRCRGVAGEELALEVSWRPYHPEMRAVSIVDLTLNGGHGDVRQELRLQLPPTPPPFVALRVPASVGDSLQIQDDRGQQVRALKNEIRNPKSEAPTSTANLGFRIPLSAQDAGKELRLLLQYTTRLGEKDRPPQGGEPFVVQLVAPEQATSADLKVRIWSELGFLPRSASSGWEEQNIEVVNGRDLPVLVLHSTKLAAPLRLALADQAEGISVLVERVLMRVNLEEGGNQKWRASFQLRQLADRHLDVLMPAPVATLSAQFVFNRHRVTPVIVNNQGEHNAGGDIARLYLPPLHAASEAVEDTGMRRPQTTTLEVTFQSQPGRSNGSPLNTLLQPPSILRATAVPTCWQVSVPPNRVLLAPESGTGVERNWTRRGWLLAGSLAMPPESRNENDRVALVRWQDESAPIVLTHAPQLAWWLVCSLGLLIIGLGLYWSARAQMGEGGRPAVWFWPTFAVMILAAAVAALFWPGLLCALAYGCEPGAVVLLAFLSTQWLVQQRYRRQIVFLPSFSRGRTGSSLIRSNSPHRLLSGEPSTVDAPPPSAG